MQCALGQPAAEVDEDTVLAAFEAELSDVVPPRFVPVSTEPEPSQGEPDPVLDVETAAVRLADVGGMSEVKQRLELAFLGPMRNPELRSLFGKSLRGGLLLYGPPGCCKTFLGRAVAGELGTVVLAAAPGWTASTGAS